MEMKKLLESIYKFAGEPEQKPGDQVRGTEKAKKGGKEHPFKGRLVGDSIEPTENILKDLSKGPAPKTEEQELAEEYAKFLEDNLGVEEKRPARKGSREEKFGKRGHKEQPRYKEIKEGLEDESGVITTEVIKLISDGHTEVSPDVITAKVSAALGRPFMLKDLVSANNASPELQHYIDSINPSKIKFSTDILTVKNQDPAKEKQAAQDGVAKMAARASNRPRLGESAQYSWSIKDDQGKGGVYHRVASDEQVIAKDIAYTKKSNPGSKVVATKDGKPFDWESALSEGWATGSDRVQLPDGDMEYWNGKGPLQKEYEALYDKLVPAMGAADTIQGEVLRAASKIYYRHHNDGDDFNQASFDQLKPYIGTVTSYDDLAHKATEYAIAANGNYTPNNGWDSLDVMEYGPEDDGSDYDEDDSEWYEEPEEYDDEEEDVDEGWGADSANARHAAQQSDWDKTLEKYKDDPKMTKRLQHLRSWKADYAEKAALAGKYTGHYGTSHKFPGEDDVNESGDTPLRDLEDYEAKRKALQDIQMDPSTSKDPELSAEVIRRLAGLKQQAKDIGISENNRHEIIVNKLKDIESRQEPDDEAYAKHISSLKAQKKEYLKKNPNSIYKQVDEYGADQPTGTAATGIGTTSVNPNDAKNIATASQALKTATKSPAATTNIVKALDHASQGKAVGQQDMKALEPLMKDIATVASEPKLSGQFKSLVQQIDRQQQLKEK